MEKTWILYIHTVTKEISGYSHDKHYVGITSESFERRCRKDGSGYKGYKRNGKSTYWWNAICKYGWDNIKHEIIASGLSKEEAIQMEKAYIAILQSNDHKYGYNDTIGGEGLHGYVWSDETRKLRSEMAKQRWKTDKKFRDIHCGKNCSFSWKRVSFKGSKHPRSKKVICLNNGEIFDWCGSAAEKYGVKTDQVRNACRGRSKGVGYDECGELCRWAYYENATNEVT